MAVKLFAAIVIGSTETEMKLYDLSQRRGIRQLSCVSRRIDLGIDAYDRGRLSTEKVERLVETLKDFRRQMDGFHVDGYRMVGTSALREIRTGLITKDHIEKQTGLSLTILSNSEQRFLDYKSIASQTQSFESVIKKGTAIVNIGGSSLQISVFDKDKLITTQNIRIGRITTRNRIYPLARNNEHFERLLRELLSHEIAGFGKLYQKDRQISTLIATNKELQLLFRSLYPQRESLIITKEELTQACSRIVRMSPDQITKQCSIPTEFSMFVAPSAVICLFLLEHFESESVWVPEISIGDGLAYDYAVENKAVVSAHAFDEDIIAAARNIAKRYKSSQAHIRNVEDLSLTIFDRTRKLHMLGRRERLLLQISAILHNCGKYISLTDVSDCAYNIVMATEIIGLSHAERQMVANIVRFNTAKLMYYDDLAQVSSVSREEYLVIAKLTAILRAANALDRSHFQRISEISVSIKKDELVLSASSDEDLTLEKATLEEKNSLFEEVFHLKPVLHQKRKTL
jgi:exopolyphosphatase/guanosine-5'-triphosphate,3'-diphosphate pyrophosphatase